MDLQITPAIDGAPTGPLSPFIERYMALIQSQGYAHRPQSYHPSLLEHFDAWPARPNLPLARIGEKLVANFLDPRVRAK